MGMERVGLGIPSLSTLFIVFSSLSLVAVERSIKLDNKNIARPLGLLSLFLGLCFIGSQFTLWESLKERGSIKGQEFMLL